MTPDEEALELSNEAYREVKAELDVLKDSFNAISANLEECRDEKADLLRLRNKAYAYVRMVEPQGDRRWRVCIMEAVTHEVLAIQAGPNKTREDAIDLAVRFGIMIHIGDEHHPVEEVCDAD